MTEQEKKSLLDKLEKQGVKFLPWIGDKYEEGIYYDEKGELCYGKGKGKKVLVVNECLYKDETEKDAERAVGNAKLSWLVYELIHRFIDDSSNFSLVVNHRPFIQFERALAGRERLTMRERTELWNHLAFYTYVQKTLSFPQPYPTENQYICSEEAFKNVLMSFSPDVIVVWGKRLFNHLPIPESSSGNGKGTWMSIEDVKMMSVPHPTSPMYTIEDLHSMLNSLLM